jgi:hypothetical protein
MKLFRKLFQKKSPPPTINDIIAAEIKDDPFYDELQKYASQANLKKILEIGSSSGGGSTDAFVNAIRARPDKDNVQLFCMELSKPRYELLSKTYENDVFVKTYNVSSISAAEFPPEAEIVHFYNTQQTNLNHHKLETVIGWYHQDLAYLKDNQSNISGIAHIRLENNISLFDMVLIDGSEFTGERELAYVIGAKVIALDDTQTFKCFNAMRALEKDSNYRLVTYRPEVRNGYAIFERVH